MTTILKTKKEQEILKEGGKKLSEILAILAEHIRPGVTSLELNEITIKLVRERNCLPAFLNYSPPGAARPFPGALCVSVNDEIVHGIPNQTKKTLQAGDIVSLDLGILYEGLITDSAITLPVGRVSKKLYELINTTRQALSAGIEASRAGRTNVDIGKAIEKFVKPFGFTIPRELGGHGVGRKVHEPPFVPNFSASVPEVVLTPGMVIAIEPMLNLGSRHLVFDSDGYTVRTKDGLPSAHFEHTVIITEKEPIIATA